MKNLIDLLPQKLKEGITPAEVRLLEAVQNGDSVDFRSGNAEENKFESADKWGNERIIRSEILYWLCTNPDAIQNIHTKGIEFWGAKITGLIDFDGASMPHILIIANCFFEEGIYFRDAKTKTINLFGSLLKSFTADGIHIEGTLFLKNVTAKGKIRLLGANINGNFECTGASFEDSFTAERAKIGGTFFLNKLKKTNGRFNFSHINVGQLMDDEESWPTQGKLILTGFEYKGFAGDNTPTKADKRIQWIRLQDKKYFSTQPYEHLAKIYRQIGHESEAREVMIAKQEDLRKYGVLNRKAKFWNWFLGKTIGHGYKPLKAVVIIIAFLILGAFIFSPADNYGVMQPSKERVYMSKEFIENKKIPSEYPQFNSFMYSMDVFVPFLDLHQEDYWLPDATKPYGFLFRIYFWFHILCGWIFSTLTAASLTGLIRKE